MAQLYKAPPGTPSTIGNQFNTFYWDRRSLIDAAWEMFFSPLADVRSMPANYGKELKVYYYVPLLDERNVNDQGIDANGVAISNADFMVTLKGSYSYVVEAGATALAAAVNAIQAGAATKSGAATPWTVTINDTTLVAGTHAEANAVVAALARHPVGAAPARAALRRRVVGHGGAGGGTRPRRGDAGRTLCCGRRGAVRAFRRQPGCRPLPLAVRGR